MVGARQCGEVSRGGHRCRVGCRDGSDGVCPGVSIVIVLDNPAAISCVILSPPPITDTKLDGQHACAGELRVFHNL